MGMIREVEMYFRNRRFYWVWGYGEYLLLGIPKKESPNINQAGLGITLYPVWIGTHFFTKTGCKHTMRMRPALNSLLNPGLSSTSF
jgi:hypothetical protein